MMTLESQCPCIALAAAAVSACGGPAATKNPEYAAAAARADAGLVAPLEDDTERRDRVVGRWAGRHRLGCRGHETRAGHRRIPERHRSGPRREVRFPERAESAAGVELVPRQPGRIQRRAVRALQDDSRPRSRITRTRRCATIARIWKREAAVPCRHRERLAGGRSITSASGPIRSTTSTAWPALRAERQAPLPFGFAFENPRSFEPLSAAETTRVRRPAAGAPRLPEHEPADREAAHRGQGGELGEAIGRASGARARLDRVFFSCGACHVGRVMVSGKMKFLPGMPNTEIEAQYYSKLLMLTGAALVESGFDPAIDHSGESRQHQAQHQRRSRAVRGDARQGAPAAGNAVRSVAAADRPREDSGACRRQRVPERHAGSHRRRREDALHLSRRREEQRLQAAAARRPRRSSRPDGCLRHRLRPGRDPYAAPGQQLSANSSAATIRRARSSRDSRRPTACRSTCRA